MESIDPWGDSPRGCATLGGAVRGAVFSENFPFFAEKLHKLGFETGTVVKMGAHLPLG